MERIAFPSFDSAVFHHLRFASRKDYSKNASMTTAVSNLSSLIMQTRRSGFESRSSTSRFAVPHSQARYSTNPCCIQSTCLSLRIQGESTCLSYAPKESARHGILTGVDTFDRRSNDRPDPRLGALQSKGALHSGHADNLTRAYAPRFHQ